MFILYFDYMCPYSYLTSERLHLLELDYFEYIERRGVALRNRSSTRAISLSPEKKDRIKREINDIQRLKTDEKIELSMPDIVPDTRNAIAATIIAGENGYGWTFHREVFRTYWSEGKDIGTIPVLSEIASRIGWSGDELNRSLDKHDYLSKTVADNLQAYYKTGAEEVPVIDFDGRIVKGVRPYEEYKKLLLDTLWDQEVYDCSCD